MVKLTLSVEDRIVRQAKHKALDLGTTVSALVTEGLQRVLAESRQELRDLADLTLRAWHHFRDGTPFIIPAMLAFRDMGFKVEPQRTGFRLFKDGRRYVVEHRKHQGQMFAIVHPRGKRGEEVARVELTTLADRVRRAKRAAEYAAILRIFWREAEKVKDHAEGVRIESARPGTQEEVTV